MQKMQVLAEMLIAIIRQEMTMPKELKAARERSPEEIQNREEILIAKCLHKDLRVQEVRLKTDRVRQTENILQDHNKVSNDLKHQDLKLPDSSKVSKDLKLQE